MIALKEGTENFKYKQMVFIAFRNRKSIFKITSLNPKTT